MSKDIALQDNNQGVELVSASPMGMLKTSVLENLKQQAESWQLAATIANQIAKTDMAGPFKGKPQDLAAAILKAASVGIPAEDVGKCIYVVHGNPDLKGETAIAIARTNGYRFEFDCTPERAIVRCTAPNGEVDESEFTIEQARKRGLVERNKNGYTTMPETMLQWRAVGAQARRFYPHLLHGMGIAEDTRQDAPIKATARRVDRPKTAGSVKAALGGVKPSEHPPVQDEAPGLLGEERALLDEIKQELGGD